MLNIVTKIDDWQAIRKQLQNKSIGLVHTMGNLHDGHMSLCQRSKKENDITIAVIFVNAKQFNQQSDFDLYPRTLEADKDLLQKYEIDYLLLFADESVYPDEYQIRIVESDLSLQLEGEFRPSHFTGMLTIVLKFLHLVQPTRAYYGEKDFQQLLLIKKMAQSLFLPYEIVACETVRDVDQLALSSRNNRLTPEQRERAAHFPRLLQSNAELTDIAEQLTALGFKVDYVIDRWQRRLGAVWLDDVRLIDNINRESRVD